MANETPEPEDDGLDPILIAPAEANDDGLDVIGIDLETRSTDPETFEHKDNG